MARGQLEKNIEDFETKVRTAKALDERMTSAPRATFYESVRRHLAGEPPQPSFSKCETMRGDSRSFVRLNARRFEGK